MTDIEVSLPEGSHSEQHEAEALTEANALAVGHELGELAAVTEQQEDALTLHQLAGHPHTHSAEEVGLGDVWPRIHSLEDRLTTQESPSMLETETEAEIPEEPEGVDAAEVEIPAESPPARKYPRTSLVGRRRRR